jgi:hypothetical protein
MSKSTHLTFETVTQELRIGGLAGGKGGQPVLPSRVPTNWYPVNLPAATAGTPGNSDCATLLDNLAKVIALLTIQQSVVLANCYRTVQAGIVAGGTFTVNNVASAATTSWFDQSINVKEAVAVDVVNKNPALAYDLALRLAVKAAAQIDSQLLALYAGFTSIAAVGAQGTTPTTANLATQIAALPNTGEPILGAFNSRLALTSSTPQSASVLQNLLALCMAGTQSVQNDNAVLFQAGTAVKLFRLLASDQVTMTGTTTQTSHNLLFLPSGLAFASADQGTSLGSAPAITPSGTQIIRSATYNDPESATPQLNLQLVIGNTGSGVQTVYVNCLGAGIVVNPGNGAVVLS